MTTDLLILTTAISMPVLLAAFYSWTSRMNQFFFFGRTVPQGFASGAEGRAIVSRYRLQIWLGCVPAAAVGAAMHRFDHATAGVWAVLVEAIVFYIAFARANAAVARIVPAAEAPCAVEVPLRDSGSNPPSFKALLSPFVVGVIVLGCAVMYMARGMSLMAAPEALNDLVAAHGGETLFSFGMGLTFAGLFAVVIRATARARTPLGQNALRSSMIATWAGVLAMTVAIAMAFGDGMISRIESKIVMAIFIMMAAGLVVFRAVVNRRYVPPPAEMQTDESWRWGLFYCNRNDPALFVQCRCGAGFTLNYGRAMAWPISAMFLAFVVALLVTSHSLPVR